MPPDGVGEASLLGEIHLGVSDPERGIVARRGDRDIIYRVGSGLEDRLPLSPDAGEAAYQPVDDTPSELDSELNSDGDPDAGDTGNG